MIGFYSAAHAIKYAVLNKVLHRRQYHAKRIAQVVALKLELLDDIPMQLDGEPWLQPASEVVVSHHGSSTVLLPPPRKGSTPTVKGTRSSTSPRGGSSGVGLTTTASLANVAIELEPSGASREPSAVRTEVAEG